VGCQDKLGIISNGCRSLVQQLDPLVECHRGSAGWQAFEVAYESSILVCPPPRGTRIRRSSTGGRGWCL